MEETAKSAFQTPITIREAVEAIHRKRYLLPAIQREFVWSPEQIIRLFDSLMRGYTIGSFLFWNVRKDKTGDFQFYEFIREYHERDRTHNPKADVTGEDNVTAILDGQQRLGGLYIALKGSYALKIPRKRWENDEAFPRTKLYINLLSKSEEFDLLYDFSFLTKEEAEEKDQSAFWFDIGKIVEFQSLRDINSFLRENNLLESEFAEDCLFTLYEVVTENRVINYYLENSQELDKVLNIFIRVNSGGTQLSYSDLLLSIATAQWKTRDAREEITLFVDEINRIGEHFYFDKDFVLKSCLVLSDLPEIAFKVDNFNSENMSKIENKWDSITKALKLSVELVSSFGYNYQTLTSANAIIPIAYYIQVKGNPDNFVLSSTYMDDRRRIKKWLSISLIKRTFSGQPDNILRPIRSILNSENDAFPYAEIVDKFKGTTKSLTFTKEDVEALLHSKYGQGHTFSVISLLYPTLNYRHRFHQDHIFPKSFFKKTKLRNAGIPEEEHYLYFETHNFLGNLQLLEELPNEEKSDKDFGQWLNSEYPDESARREFMERHYIPSGISLDSSNFLSFFKKRSELIWEKLESILM